MDMPLDDFAVNVIVAVVVLGLALVLTGGEDR